MTTEVENINNGAIIRITGEVDLSVSPAIKEKILEQMYGSPELKELDEYTASFCALGGKSQSQQIVNEHLKTRK